jgi:glycyl-tRNA synthetase
VDGVTNERYVPSVVEPAAGADRALLSFIVDAYDEEEVAGRTRVVLRLHPQIAPVKAAVLPLIGKDAGMVAKARALFEDLRRVAVVEYDDSAQIGRRYRRQDEIGTPFAFTVDEQTLEDDTVTLRNRDSLAQERIGIAGARAALLDHLTMPWSTPKTD